MSPANGHANGATATASGNIGETFGPLPTFGPKNGLQFSSEQVKELITALEVPFDPRVIEWRVTNTAKDKRRGQVIPYADQFRKMDFLELCQWFTKSIRLFDLADRSCSNQTLRVAAENLRAAAIEFVVSLARRDARIAELLEKEFRSTLSVANSARVRK